MVTPLLFLLFGGLLTGFILLYLKTEHRFYYWDSLQYQEKLIQICSEHIPINKRFDLLLSSIQHDSYTDLGVYPLLPFCRVFGTNRLPYILYIYFLYGVPAALVIFLAVRSYARSLFPITTLSNVIMLFTTACIPQLWVPVLMGFIDVSGLICVGFVLLITFRKKINELNIKDIAGIVMGLTIMIFLRRWYAYWAVGYVGGLSVELLLFSLFQKNYTPKQFFQGTARVVLIAGGVSLVLFLVGGSGLIQRFTADYASIYYPWKFESSAVAIIDEFVANFGLLVSLIFVFGAIVQGIVYPFKSRILFLISSFFITFFLFHTVQSFGPQHLYLLLPTILIVVSTTISLGICRLKGVFKYIGIILVLLLFVVNFLWVFVPVDSDKAGGISRLFSQYRYPPLVRQDFDSIRALLQKTQDLYGQQEGWVTLVASSEELNGSLLRYACGYFQFKQTFCSALALYGGLDIDGFPDMLFNSVYLLVAEPTQTHLRPSDQRVLVIFAEEIKKPDSLGQYFEKLTPGYTLDNGVTVYIYLPKEPVPAQTIRALFGDLVNIKLRKF
jgi:hypothetical protein